MDDVADQAAEERDIGSSADGRMDVGDGAGACEARVDVDELRSTLFGEHGPAEADGMVLRHVRTLDDDAIRIREILKRGGCATATKRGAQTGHRRGVSNTSLIFDLENAGCIEELLDEIVFFIIESRAAEMRHA